MIELHKEKESVENSLAEPRAFGVSRMHLEGFRNYRSQTLELSEGFNVLAGPNAQGKTNFLESIYLLSTTRLLRGQRDGEAVLEGAERARVEADLTRTRTTLAVVLERGVRKRALINGLSLPRAADLLGRLPCVCISTADMEIARGEPSLRRLYLDLELSSLYPAYLRSLSHYKRALEQRNAVLRDGDRVVDPPLLEPWEAQMAEHGAFLRRSRAEYLAAAQRHAGGIHAEMGSGEKLEIEYLPRDPAHEADRLLAALEASRSQDAARGGTGVGPHRDDFMLKIDGRDGRLFGSQGQQRTAVIALKLGGLEHARLTLGASPVILLDDILSDLDGRRREALVELVLQCRGQAVLTCTEAGAAGDRILNQARIFQVSDGSITSS
jgi:DNA replication and repair protein RecF